MTKTYTAVQGPAVPEGSELVERDGVVMLRTQVEQLLSQVNRLLETNRNLKVTIACLRENREEPYP